MRLKTISLLMLVFSSVEAAKPAGTGTASMAVQGAVMNLPFSAATNNVKVSDDGTHVTLTVPVRSFQFDTPGMWMTPQQQKKFPQFTLTFIKGDLRLASPVSSPHPFVPATLTINGIAASIEPATSVTLTGQTYSITMSAPIRRLAFSVGTKDTAKVEDGYLLVYKFQLPKK